MFVRLLILFVVVFGLNSCQALLSRQWQITVQSGLPWVEMGLTIPHLKSPKLGTWLDTCAKPWGVGCKVCNQSMSVSIFANYEVTKPTQMQKINFQKHQKTKAHLGAVRDYLHRTGGWSGHSGMGCFGPANPSREGGCLGPRQNWLRPAKNFLILLEKLINQQPWRERSCEWLGV